MDTKLRDGVNVDELLARALPSHGRGARPASMFRRHPSPWIVAPATLLVFLGIENVRRVFWLIPAYARLAVASPAVAVSAWKLCQPVLCVAAIALTYRGGVRASTRELGLKRPVARAMMIGMLLTLPTLVLILGATGGRLAGTPAAVLVRSSLASAVAEEVLYRGYLFRQLYRRLRWPFWLAVLCNALPFAAGHLYQVHGRGIAGALEVLGYMSLVAAFAAWVFTRWDDNIWLLISLHGFANLWWDLFIGDASDRLYGWVQWAVLATLLVPVVAATLARHRLPWAAWRDVQTPPEL